MAPPVNQGGKLVCPGNAEAQDDTQNDEGQPQQTQAGVYHLFAPQYAFPC